jgi:2-amino-4-hydroxy-6-hydroxymethyldihydropteridine diphosphokinase
MNSGIFLLLGTNLGDRMINLSLACEHIASRIGKVLAVSSIYQTAAWGKTDQPDFYNQVIRVDTALPPHELLKTILNIELLMGRVRTERWGTRTIDIDILFYNDLQLNEPDLVIPHPGIPQRRFTLEPLAEIAGNFLHPASGKSIDTVLKECPDESVVSKILQT